MMTEACIIKPKWLVKPFRLIKVFMLCRLLFARRWNRDFGPLMWCVSTHVGRAGKALTLSFRYAPSASSLLLPDSPKGGGCGR